MLNLLEQVFPDRAEDDRLWKARLRIPETLKSERIPSGRIAQYLGFQQPKLEQVALSVEDSMWLTYQNGNYLVEIRNLDNFKTKLERNGGMVVMADMDDTLLDTTTWHQHEYEIIHDYLRGIGVDANEGQVAAIYELSKIYIPGVAEVQTRYTPLLNFILLDQFIRRQKHEHMTPDEAMQWVTTEQCRIQERVTQIGEGVLNDYRYNKAILYQLLEKNSPNNYLHVPLIQDLFGFDSDNDDSTIRIIITRGKIEGPLGQVYKVHGSGMMTLPSVDAVVYTNDVKIRALLSLDIFLPTLKQNRIVLLYDDNPSEIIPFYQKLEELSPFCIELIHTRQAGAKRRKKTVMIPESQGKMSEKLPCATIGYNYGNNESPDIEIESFDGVPPGKEATIFDHHVAGSKGLVVVI